jgi:hypothetical protein
LSNKPFPSQVFRLKPEIVVQSTRDKIVRIMPVAALTCLNIVLGNVSLRFVPVSFMQTIKCFTPATTSETAFHFLFSLLLFCSWQVPLFVVNL